MPRFWPVVRDPRSVLGVAIAFSAANGTLP
jgi:hypothetical protein